MNTEQYWESMGLLKDFDKADREYALRFYDTISSLLNESRPFRQLLKDTEIGELWDSYLPETNEEWFKCSLKSNLGSDAVELKYMCKWDESNWEIILYELVYKLLKYYKALDITDLIDALRMVYIEPLINHKRVVKLKSYETLYNFVLEVLLAQCAAFYEINNESDRI